MLPSIKPKYVAPTTLRSPEKYICKWEDKGRGQIKLLSARLCQGSIADAISTLTKLLLKVLSCPTSNFSAEAHIGKSKLPY